MKPKFENRAEIEAYIKENNFTEAKALCNNLFELVIKRERKSIRQGLEAQLENGKYPYCTLYTDLFKVPNMINKYFEGVTKSDIDRAFVLRKGKDFEDGFSGMFVKAVSYTTDYVIEFVDGENGQQFVKKYKKFPSTELLIMDTLLESYCHGVGEYFDFTIEDLFTN